MNRFEAELARALNPVPAPDALWERIQQGQAAPSLDRLRWPWWAFAAALAATIALFCFSLRSDTTSALARVAAEELGSAPDTVDFRSADPVRIRAWVQANTGLDLPLPASPSVELVGVRLIRGMACVSYRVGNRPAKLLVARAATAAPPHRAMDHTVYRGAALASWSMQGQSFLLASSSPQDSRAACVLCHVD